MCVITDPDFIGLVNDFNMIDPFDLNCLTPVGYDLRVGTKACTSGGEGMFVLSAENPLFYIKPHSTALISTLEKINMPTSHMFSGIICSKVSLVAEGLSHVSTTVDPDYTGTLLIVLHNHSSKSIPVNYGDQICTFMLLKNLNKSILRSNTVENRNDILIKEYAKNSIIAKKRDSYKTFLLFSVTPILTFLAIYASFKKFGNAPGFAASIAFIIFANQLIINAASNTYNYTNKLK